MSNANKSQAVIAATHYAARVLRSDSLKKGAAAGAAGIVIALITEALWPTRF